MTEDIAKVVTIGELFAQKNGKLKIPDYQRSYKWSQKHVSQLLDDLKFHMQEGLEHYRVGTVVLHKDNEDKDDEALHIVDGQQRTVTLCLILHALGLTSEDYNPLMRGELNTYLLENSISQRNIQNNYAVIIQQLETIDDKSALKDFILKKCEVVQVVLEDLSEAFQFFDSQNARGKSLEPYDLLKAFHLREMGDETKDKKACVEQWESAIQKGELKPLFNEYLYRIRKWSRGHSAFYFTKDDVGLFKGVSLNNKNKHDYPYTQTMRATNYLVEQYQANPFMSLQAYPFMSLQAYPFQIDQVMINGKRFFEYVEHYRQQLDMLKNKKHEIFETISSYDGRYRTGDGYTRNLFQAALLYYVDKFGESHLDEAIRTAFFWAYSIRLENAAVRLATMDNKAREEQGMFRVVSHAVHPREMLNFPFHKATTNSASKVEEIAMLFGIDKQGEDK
jgi:hypothetical protein